MARVCSDCDRPLGPYNHSVRCISCNFRRKRIREQGLLSEWPDTPEYEAALDKIMQSGGPHIPSTKESARHNPHSTH